MERRRILVVDDNPDAAGTLAMVLEVEGHEVRIAEDGHAALAVAEGFRPDVIFMDIGMPGMDGWETAREIRSRPWGEEIVILALTGYGTPGDRMRSRDAGIDEHLVKPLDPSRLDALLSRRTHRAGDGRR